MAHAHRAGSLKQRNKPFKKRTAAPAPVSATAFQAAERRKAAAPAIAAAVRAINKQQRGLQTKHKRTLQLQRLQQLRQSLRGSAACDHAALPPRVVLVLSFNKTLPSSCVCAALAQQLAADAPETSRVAKGAAVTSTFSGPVAREAPAAVLVEQETRKHAQAGVPKVSVKNPSVVAQSAAPPAHICSTTSCGIESNERSKNVPSSRNKAQNSDGETRASSVETFVHALPSYACCPSLPHRTQQRLLLLPAPCPKDLLSLLTLCSCADLLLCVFAGECTYTEPAFDEEGYRFLAALKMQGVPPVTGVGLSPSVLNSLLASSVSQHRHRQRGNHNDIGEAEVEEEMRADIGEFTGSTGAEERTSPAIVGARINKKEKEKESVRFQQRYFLSEFGQDKRFVSVHTPGDWRKVLRTVGSAHIPPDVAAKPETAGGDLQWRRGRGYMLALDWKLLTEKQLQEQKYPKVHMQEQQQIEPIEKLYLQVDGFVRGVGFTKRLPIHVTGVGNFIAQRIEVLHSTPGIVQKSLSGVSTGIPGCSDSSSNSCVNSRGSGESNSSKDHSSRTQVQGEVDMVEERGGPKEDEGIEELDCEQLSAAERTELLQLIQPLQPFDRSSLEQTWPTEAELQLTEQQQQENQEAASEREQEGSGDFFDKASNHPCTEGEEKAEEHSDDEVDGRWDEEFLTSNKDAPDLPALHPSDPKRNYTIEQRAAEDLEFPDEVDTPLNIEARVRFQKYRGLKSFRTSTWNREMDLPLEYSRVVDFQRLKSLQTYAYATLRNLCARNVFQGRFCRITVPLHLVPDTLVPAATSAAAASAPATVPVATAACSCDLELPSSQHSLPASWDHLLLRCSAEPQLARTVQQLRDQLVVRPSSTVSISSISAISSCSVCASGSCVSATGAVATFGVAGSCVAELRACTGREEGQLPPHLVLSTLLPFETAVSVAHMSLMRGGGGGGSEEDVQKRSMKSKEEVLFVCGFRRFLARPIYSTVAATSASGGAAATEKAKFLSFFHPSSSCIATLYCCTIFPPATVLAFTRNRRQHQPLQEQHSQPQQQEHSQQQPSQEYPHLQKEQGSGAPVIETAPTAASGKWNVFAWGSVLHSSSNRIILKRIVLTGYPFRVHKRKAVVRYMFFNPRDIRWFMPVELHTKKGLRGNILQPLGTHGYMKCRFNLPIKQDDTVCMCLYKRVFPKWYPPSWNGHIDQLPESECDPATTRQDHYQPHQDSGSQHQKQPPGIDEEAEMLA